MTFAVTDIEQPFHVHIATVLPSPVGMVDQPDWYQALGQRHLQSQADDT